MCFAVPCCAVLVCNGILQVGAGLFGRCRSLEEPWAWTWRTQGLLDDHFPGDVPLSRINNSFVRPPRFSGSRPDAGHAEAPGRSSSRRGRGLSAGNSMRMLNRGCPVSWDEVLSRNS